MTLKGMALVLLCGAAARAEDREIHITPRPAPRKIAPARSIRVDASLILVPVTVTNPFGAPFPGLRREAFHLSENGVEQEIRYFSSEDAPVSFGVVFDASRSMRDKIGQSREAVFQFLRAAMPADEFFVIEFNSTPTLLCRFTRDTAEVEKVLAGIRPKAWTALLDAIYMATHQMKSAHNRRKALLVLSDGGDNNSRYTESEMKSLVREADVCIYSIALASGGLVKRHARLLRELAEETGGLLCEIDKTSDLPAAVERIGAAIRNQYVLGYFSNRPANDGLYRKIRVTLSQPNGAPPLRASWRGGYYAPDGP